MLLRTHLVIAVCAILLFVSHVNYPFSFVIITLVAAVLPDIDSGFSTIGKNRLFRPLQFLTKHRGFIHSFTFAVLVAILLSLFAPFHYLAFPFFLGYALHLFADCFTKEGIYPFWPYLRKALWKIKTGGVIEDTVFVTFIIIDIILFLFLLGF